MEPEPVEENSTKSQPARTANLYAIIKGARTPQAVTSLRTAQEIFDAFPGLYYQRLYNLVELGLIRVYRRDGRKFYVEEDVAEALRAGNFGRSMRVILPAAA